MTNCPDPAMVCSRPATLSSLLATVCFRPANITTCLFFKGLHLLAYDHFPILRGYLYDLPVWRFRLGTGSGSALGASFATFTVSRIYVGFSATSLYAIGVVELEQLAFKDPSDALFPWLHVQRMS